MLAGVSIDYYVQMERGSLAGVSEQVLDAVANALQLDDVETAHLHDLARAATPATARRRRGTTPTTVRGSLHMLLDAITDAPAWIANPRSDVIATNVLGAALLAPLLDDPVNQRNNARFTFFSPASRIFYPDWERGADSVAANLRTRAGQNPHDKDLTDLIGELVTRSDDFRRRWSAHDVRVHRTGTKRIHHPEVGDLEFTFEGLALPDNPGWMLYTYLSPVGTPTAERVRLLGSLAATPAAASTTPD